MKQMHENGLVGQQADMAQSPVAAATSGACSAMLTLHEINTQPDCKPARACF
jgi:hypothetical protein